MGFHDISAKQLSGYIPRKGRKLFGNVFTLCCKGKINSSSCCPKGRGNGIDELILQIGMKLWKSRAELEKKISPPVKLNGM